MREVAPLWLICALQAASVVGDALGQRCSRFYFDRRTRRFLVGLSFMSAVQVFVIFGAIELASPLSPTLRNVTVEI